MKTRIIALVLAVCMMLGLCAFASAADDVHVCSGGTNCDLYGHTLQVQYGPNNETIVICTVCFMQFYP